MLFLPAFIVATQMYNSWSLRTVLLICSFVILIGAWMRVMLAFTGNFWWLIAGQTVIGISNPITTGGVSIIANFWFADNERGIATSLMMVSNPLGFFVSFLF
jgi:predicted MFS family arabinose efflux permease